MTTHTGGAGVLTMVAARLAAQEAIITRGLHSYIEIGDALTEIRDGRLYLEGYASFEGYCKERWGFGRDYADRMITAAGIVLTIVSTGLPMPSRESQARELAKVPEAERIDVWRETLERTGGRPTAAAVRQAAAPAPAPPTPEPRARQDSVQIAPSPARRPDSVPASTADEVDAARRREVLATARHAGERIVSALRVDAVALVAAVELGELDLITPQMVADLRAVVALLEAQLDP